MSDKTKETKRRFDDVLGKMLKTPPKPHEVKGDGQKEAGKRKGETGRKPSRTKQS